LTREQAVLTSSLKKISDAAQTPEDKKTVADLTANEAAVDQAISALSIAPSAGAPTALAAAIAKINSLADGLENVSMGEIGIVGNDTITYTTADNRNYQSQTWALDYINKLQPLAKRIAADPLKTESAANLASLADASSKQAILTLTVQFQSPSRFELTTGIMVPVRPYHSYAKGSDSTGTATAQETTTYAVVPIALVNWRWAQWITRQEPSASFLTGGIGINSSTSAVEFGAGATYSYRSFAISFLADIGRDTQLGGSLKPNGPLGSYTAPPTMPKWGVRFAPAISVRIPLGGSSPGK
jgi:hypothetical protein